MAQCYNFLPFHTVRGLPFPSPVDHVLSEHSSMTCLSWVALHCMAPSFIEFDRAVVHVISFMFSNQKLIVIVIFILSALCWIRIRGLWKVPDGRD